MSTWQRNGQRRFDRVDRSALGGAEFVRPQLTWRDMQPILLRSAAVVGLGAAMAAAVANGAFLPELDPRPVELAAVLTVHDDPAVQMEAGEAPSTTALPATRADEATPAAAPVAAAPAAATAPRTVSPAQPAPAARTHGAAAEPALAYAPPVAAPSTTAAPAVTGTSSGAAESAAEPATVGSLPPTECLGSGSAAGGPCAQTAALVAEPGDPAPQPSVDAAGSEQDPELTAFMPRIPKARPEPPPQLRKTARKANWPADDPPNCGNKRARWRYVNDVPTWYCR